MSTHERKKQHVNSRLALTLAGTALAVLAFTGCTAAPPTPTETTSSPAEEAPPAAATELGVADSSLGQIVVDGQGLTVYYFDNDTVDSGVSACTDGCLDNWPIVTSATDTPVVDGVTGTVGTIPTPDGGFQVTINGLPIYLYAGDSAAGDVNGQGVGGVWWAVAPSGDKIA
jgi:predicted lipoprotein with Yx(FWY)xxD motif